ncbi:unnamed protein product, partial [Bubo scandiacus]
EKTLRATQNQTHMGLGLFNKSKGNERLNLETTMDRRSISYGVQYDSSQKTQASCRIHLYGFSLIFFFPC